MLIYLCHSFLLVKSAINCIAIIYGYLAWFSESDIKHTSNPYVTFLNLSGYNIKQQFITLSHKSRMLHIVSIDLFQLPVRQLQSVILSWQSDSCGSTPHHLHQEAIRHI